MVHALSNGLSTDITCMHQQRQYAAGECSSERRNKPKKDTTEPGQQLGTKLGSNEFRTILVKMHGNAAAAGGSQFFAIFRNYPQFFAIFSQLLLDCPACMLVGALCLQFVCAT